MFQCPHHSQACLLHKSMHIWPYEATGFGLHMPLDVPSHHFPLGSRLLQDALFKASVWKTKVDAGSTTFSMVNDSIDAWAPGMPSRFFQTIELGLASPSWWNGAKTDYNTQPTLRRPGCPSSSQDKDNIQWHRPILQRPAFLPQSSHLWPHLQGFICVSPYDHYISRVTG